MKIADDVLFVGRGASAVAYYRCLLPAMALGCDWVGFLGAPPNLRWRTGTAKRGIRGDSSPPPLEEYKVVILQQPSDPAWIPEVARLQREGVKVVFEIDDYIHGIPKLKSHDNREHFDKKMLATTEILMRMSDAVITSTEFLAKRYRKHNRNIHVCKNALDPSRYVVTRPERETVNIGWAGGTGHREALMEWMPAIAEVMKARPETRFISIGQPWARVLPQFGIEEDRILVTPFMAIENYPAAMCLLDIALAPAGRSAFFRGKSDLRWLEAGILGIPSIVNPLTYPLVQDGMTGFTAESPQEAHDKLSMLVQAPRKMRDLVGEATKEYVLKERTFPAAGDQWREVIESL